MEKERLGISRHPSLRWAAALFLLLAVSCSMPHVIIVRDPLTASEHNDLGVIYEQKGQFDLAEKEYLKAVEKDGKWYLPLFNLGNLSYQKSDLEKAERYYRRSLALDTSNPDVMNNLASLLHDISLDHEATELISRALSIERKPEYLDTYKKIMGYFPDEDEAADSVDLE
jgi:tetratricopeptide (TPR) repeat protein